MENIFVSLAKTIKNVVLGTPGLGLKDVLQCLEQEDYKKAFQGFYVLAKKGDPLAQVKLGIMYYEGLGNPVNQELAAVWFKKAAEQGRVDALINLGSMYLEGIGVQKSSQQSFQCFLEAAQYGSSEAQYKAGMMLYHGIGVAQDFQSALVWLFKVADKGHAKAQQNLAVMYEKGQGLMQDDRQASIWYRKSAEQGVVASQLRLAEMYRDGRGVTKDDKLARYWQDMAVEKQLNNKIVSDIYEKGNASENKEKLNEMVDVEQHSQELVDLAKEFGIDYEESKALTAIQEKLDISEEEVNAEEVNFVGKTDSEKILTEEENSTEVANIQPTLDVDHEESKSLTAMTEKNMLDVPEEDMERVYFVEKTDSKEVSEKKASSQEGDLEKKSLVKENIKDINSPFIRVPLY